MIILIIVLGLLIGSFLNVCIYRIPRHETVVTTPSHCTSCGKRIKWYDLIPVISYIILGGKCRNCGTKISIRYPLVELINAIFWTAVYMCFGLTVLSVSYMLLCSILLVIALIDYKHQVIPNGLLMLLLIFGVFFNIISLNRTSIIYALIGFFIVSVPLLIISIITKGGIGGGDIKLMAVCGLYLGFKLIIVSFLFGIILAGSLSAVLLLLKVKHRGDVIPLGPFLSFGVILSLFAGNSVIAWYLQFFK